jgi:hypothetical protein
MLKHFLGVVSVLLTIWGLGSLYNAVVDPAHYWLQGLVGTAMLAGAVMSWRNGVF